MKKHFLVAFSFVLVFVGATMFSRQEERKDAFNEIRVNMPKSEVRRLLGAAYTEPSRTRKLAWGGVEDIGAGSVLHFLSNDHVAVFRN